MIVVGTHSIEIVVTQVSVRPMGSVTVNWNVSNSVTFAAVNVVMAALGALSTTGVPVSCVQA